MERASHIRRIFRRFSDGDSGAVTVDWVVLTASVLVLAMGAGYAVTANVPELAGKISEELDETEVGTW